MNFEIALLSVQEKKSKCQSDGRKAAINMVEKVAGCTTAGVFFELVHVVKFSKDDALLKLFVRTYITKLDSPEKSLFQ